MNENTSAFSIASVRAIVCWKINRALRNNTYRLISFGSDIKVHRSPKNWSKHKNTGQTLLSFASATTAEQNSSPRNTADLGFLLIQNQVMGGSIPLQGLHSSLVLLIETEQFRHRQHELNQRIVYVCSKTGAGPDDRTVDRLQKHRTFSTYIKPPQRV